MAPVGGAVGGANGTRGSPVSFALNSSSTGAPPTASTAVSGIGLSTAAVTTAASATNGHGHAFVGNAAAAAVASVSPIAASRGQLLRFEQLTEPEREELRQEARLPIYLPRNLQDDESCIQDPDELRSSPVLSEDSPASLPQTFRSRERMRTSSVALVMCLNLGVDPPDVVKVSPCARMECWIDPATHLSSQVSSRSLLDKIGAALQKQYERWHARARYKLALDPTIEDVKKLCAGLRKFAKDERVLFHYNGHGVPKPTCNGEIWVFNKLYTQYIPLSLYDLQQWIGSPSIFVYDCSGSGILLSKFNSWKDQQQLQQKQNLCKEDCCILPRPHSIYLHQISASVESHSAFSVSKANSATVNGHDVTQSSSPLSTHPSLPNFENCIQLAACREDEVLPMQPTLPADIFTACLTTPIAMALRCYVLNNPFQLVPGLSLDAVEKIPGSLIDRRTMLGELNWIFTAITDTIAWNVLPKALFQRLFRQDLLVASLFRNFLLSQRIMRLYDCNPQSNPALPKTFDHPMWYVILYIISLPLLTGYYNEISFISKFHVWFLIV